MWPFAMQEQKRSEPCNSLGKARAGPRLSGDSRKTRGRLVVGEARAGGY